MQDKLVTIGIPAYNSDKFIKQTIDSLINQSYSNIEILISDNGSTDNTQNVDLEYLQKDKRVHYFKNDKKSSYSENCNKLISLAKGHYVAIYHSDDVYDYNIVKKEVQVLCEYPEILGIFSLYEQIDEHGNHISPIKYPIPFNQEIFTVDFSKFVNVLIDKGGSCFCCPTSMIRRDVYLKLNGYNEKLKYIEDQDMWLRILMTGKMAILKEKLIKYRIHSSQGSSIYKDSSRNIISIPLSHLKTFLEENDLIQQYKIKLDIAETKDCLYLAYLSLKRKNYNDFINWIEKSKKIYKLNLFSKYGFFQINPFPKYIYYLINRFYK
jgi:glycosyltransferase involved in cell wall biosynthesis